jgi:glycosyltransferase involved in cell wall biosynthesis
MRRISGVRELAFAIPGNLDTRTGGYGYARRLIAGLRELGWRVAAVPLPGSFPYPAEADVTATATALATIPHGVPKLVDGLAFGAFPPAVFDHVAGPWVALVHHPLAAETGLAPLARETLHASERAALRHAAAVIVTSPHTKATLERDYGVDSDRLTVALPGTDPAPRATGSGNPVEILTVASLTFRKGLDVLVRALETLAPLPWHATVVGSARREPDTAGAVIAQILSAGLTDRITLAGECDDAQLAAAYARADLFVLPSRYEGYGMVLAEALARGLPIVASNAGAIPETVAAGAGVLVPAEDVSSLANAISRLIAAPVARGQMADAAWQAGQRLPRWPETAQCVASALSRLPQLPCARPVGADRP